MKRKPIHNVLIIVLSASIMLLATNLVHAKKWVVSVNGLDSGIGSEKSPL